MITQEQWEKACKRAGINARSGPMHVAHRRSDMPPIGDPATVLKMLEWLIGHGHAIKLVGYWGFGEGGVRKTAWYISPTLGEGFPDDEPASPDDGLMFDTPTEAIVHAVLALPEATDG